MAAVVATAVANSIVKAQLLTSVRTIRDQLQAQFDESMLLARAQGVLMAMQQCSSRQADMLIQNAADRNAESLMETATRIIRAAESGEV